MFALAMFAPAMFSTALESPTLFVVLVGLVVGLVVMVAVLVAVLIIRRRAGAPVAGSHSTPLDTAIQRAVADAVAELRLQSVAERDAAVQAALEHTAVLQREQLSAAATSFREQSLTDLGAKKDVIDARLEQVHDQMRGELRRLSEMVASLAEANANKFGQFDEALRSHAEVTRHLSESTGAIRDAMASPTARGQWGERMAEDVLRLAGFVENVNYVKQVQLDGATGRPDFTFPLPKGHELYMDVKFPMAGYLRYLDAATDSERSEHRSAFLRDVRARVRELADRDYATESAKQSVDYVLLFLPNEQLTGFIHEADPTLLDDAMARRVVICSPLTLFAFLGVIRQAYDNFVIEQTSDQILSLIGTFGQQWQKYSTHMDKVKRSFDTVERQFDQLVGVRRRALEKPLSRLDDVRRERNLPIDLDLFAELTSADGDGAGDVQIGSEGSVDGNGAR